MGKSISAETDNKLLVPLLSTHTLDQLPSRIQRFILRLMRFHFKEIKHASGKKIHIADALSRLQIRNQTAKSTTDDHEMRAHIVSLVSSPPASDARLQQTMKEDPVFKQIKVYCYEGWPDKHSLNDATKPYWSSWDELSVVQNILLKASRIVSPSYMRLEILDKCADWELTKLIDIKRQEYTNDRDKVSHCQSFHLRLALEQGSKETL